MQLHKKMCVFLMAPLVSAFVFLSSEAYSKEVLRDSMASRDDAKRLINSVMRSNPGSCSVEVDTSTDLAAICLDSSEGWVGIYWTNGRMRLVKFTDSEVGRLGLTRE